VHLEYDALGRVRSASCDGQEETYDYSPDGLRTVIQQYRDQRLLKTRYQLYNDARQLVSQYELPAGSAQPVWTRDILYLGTRQVGEADEHGVHLALVDPLGTPGVSWMPKASWKAGRNSCPLVRPSIRTDL